VEGEDASVDRLTYHKIAQLCFPDAHLIPTGSVENVIALNRLSKELQQSIFGIEFFMVRDRDGLSNEQISALEATGRFKCLRRRHVENYFLDTEVLAQVATDFYLDTEWRKSENIEHKLVEIARSSLPQAVMMTMKHNVTMSGSVDTPRAVDLDRKSLEDCGREFARDVAGSLERVGRELAESVLIEMFEKEKALCEKALEGDAWKVHFPGKLMFGKLCGAMNQDSARIREKYIDVALATKPDVFAGIRRIFEDFRKLCA
jgi:hypothetical protein